MASCSAYDVVEILAKQREPLRDFHIQCCVAHFRGHYIAYYEVARIEAARSDLMQAVAFGKNAYQSAAFDDEDWLAKSRAFADAWGYAVFSLALAAARAGVPHSPYR